MAGGEGLNLLPTRVVVRNSDGIAKTKVTNRERKRKKGGILKIGEGKEND